MGLSSKSRVRFRYHCSGRVRVPKKLGFPWILGDFGFPATSLLMGLGSKSRVRVTKKSGFPQVLGYRVPEPITMCECVKLET